MKKKLKVPKFKNEDKEREFWSRIEWADYLEPADLTPASFTNLKPTSRSVSIRIPEYILLRVKEQANELNVPYQTLIKQHIAKGVLEKIK